MHLSFFVDDFGSSKHAARLEPIVWRTVHVKQFTNARSTRSCRMDVALAVFDMPQVILDKQQTQPLPANVNAVAGGQCFC